LIVLNLIMICVPVWSLGANERPEPSSFRATNITTKANGRQVVKAGTPMKNDAKNDLRSILIFYTLVLESDIILLHFTEKDR